MMGGFNMRGIFPALSLACAGMAAAVPPAHVFLIEANHLPAPDVARRRVRLSSLPLRYRRGKRAQAKPTRRTNRLHTSKRVRRKHRRAA